MLNSCGSWCRREVFLHFLPGLRMESRSSRFSRGISGRRDCGADSQRACLNEEDALGSELEGPEQSLREPSSVSHRPAAEPRQQWPGCVLGQEDERGQSALSTVKWPTAGRASLPRHYCCHRGCVSFVECRLAPTQRGSGQRGPRPPSFLLCLPKPFQLCRCPQSLPRL